MTKSLLALSGLPLALEDVASVALHRRSVSVDPAAKIRIEQARAVVERSIAAGRTVYGINTGFGKLSDVVIPPEQIAALQKNLVRSHACGLGNELSDGEVRAMLLMRANVLALGCSGVRPSIVDRLCDFLNLGVHPIVPSKGSVGASGDLAPLAHLALPLIGEGMVRVSGRKMSAQAALTEVGLAPIELEAKEGLALLNGTQAHSAVGALAIIRALRVAGLMDLAGAMSLEALLGTPAAFDERIHRVRPHTGQLQVAAHLRALLEGSQIRESHRFGDARVQDAYCLRCMPQVHGAVRDALQHVRALLETESGSATDNPLIFAAEEEIISGGNFHGAPLAYALDYAAIAMTDLISISERRIDRMINPDLNEGLPAFLSERAGVSSGFMIAHVSTAALLNEAKVLAHPASTDSVPTSGGKEDHVSMAMTGALKLRQIVENAEYVLAIEMMLATQGIEHRRPLRSSTPIVAACERVRLRVDSLGDDRVLADDIARLSDSLREGEFDQWV